MLDIDNLGNELTNAIRKISNSLLAHTAIANTINSYLIENLEAYCDYEGFITTPLTINPDPLSGEYMFKAITVTLLPPLLLAGATGGIDAWLLSIGVGLTLTVFNPIDDTGIVTGVPCVIPPLPITIDLSSCESFDQCMHKLAEAIINTLKDTTPLGGGAGKSASATNGTITFTRFE